MSIRIVSDSTCDLPQSLVEEYGITVIPLYIHMDGGSWTNNLSWVRGYDDVLGPMEKASSLFHEKAIKGAVPTSDHRYRNALFHLLNSQTSCYRYWGEGRWTDYGKEICRRATEILEHDF